MPNKIKSFILHYLISILCLKITLKTCAFTINMQKNNPKPSSLSSSKLPPPLSSSPPTAKYESYPSTFDPEIPSGIRGEAVRANLRSKTRGIWCNPIELNSCVIHIHRKGTINFLNNKLSSAFGPNASQESCILTSKGKVFDKVIMVVEGEEDAYVITSPYSGNSLFDTLGDLIFPL